jgi:hypothetical protein
MSLAEDRGVRLRGPLAAGQQQPPSSFAWRQENSTCQTSPSMSPLSTGNHTLTPVGNNGESSSVQTMTALEAENAALRRRVAALERSAAAASAMSLAHMSTGLDLESGSRTAAVAASGAFWPELIDRVSWLVRESSDFEREREKENISLYNTLPRNPSTCVELLVRD